MAPHSSLYQMTSSDLDILDDDHRNTLNRAINNILSTEVAELTYAQILDGLPTEDSLWDSFDFVKDHPVQTIQHSKICPGYVEKARELRAQLKLDHLNFELKTLKSFQDEPFGSHSFDLRLIELVVIACHQIGAYAYSLDEGAHKHKLYQEWRDKVLEEKQQGVESRRYYLPPPTAFCHRAYRCHEQYPRGLADVAGYWAESKIFGGVVVFDRGETEDQCKSMWIHGDLYRSPRTLYPPTEKQFDALTKFLTAPPEANVQCPLPIHGSLNNRPRWHAYHAFAYYHIFRDRFERKLPSVPPRRGCVQSGKDWPELDDQRILMQAGHYTSEGEPFVTKEEYDAAMERIRNITPSSPCWTLFHPNGSS